MNMRRLLIALLLVAVGCDDQLDFCDKPEVAGSEQAVVNGALSTNRRATVIVWSPAVGYCSGVVLAPHTVLTSAHCDSDGMGIQTGPGSNGYTVVDRLKHPAHVSGGGPHDLLLLYTDEPLPGPYARVYLDNPVNLDRLVAQGWGKSQYSCVALLDMDMRLKEVGEGYLIATPPSAGGPCYGDSGGGLWGVVEGGYVLVGVLSTAEYPYCESGGWYVRLAPNVDWLEANKI
jgi:secreted trypsin-like serine protease